MFLSLQEMELRKLCFDETFAPGEIEFVEAKARQASPLLAAGSAEVLPNAEGEFRVRGHLSVRMASDCDRCLEVVSIPIDLDFDLFYAPTAAGPDADEREIDKGEAEIGFYEGDGLELEEILREQVLLALPMRRVCREDCRGICPLCGQNRNVTACGCEVKPVDDRWAALRDL